MNSPKRTSFYVIVLLLIFGSIGIVLNQRVFADYDDLSKQQVDKILRVIQLVKYYYVENVEWDEAVGGAISGMLSSLDPHSVYIEPRKVEKNKEDFSGQYEGIGIEFDVINGYITVITPIDGAPADQLGLQSGDKIVKINGKSAIGIERDEVPKKLKGPKGTEVDVTIVREGMKEPFELTIIRDVIPIHTVTTKFMADDSTAYIKVNRFAATTTKETEAALQELEEQGMTRLILDLRGNPGGYLHEAVKLAGKFIGGHHLIVETRGKNQRVDEKFFSDQWNGSGKTYEIPLIILINRGSASASEIVSGAVQDYDRGLILGTNSFGKGLVQKEFTLSDGSAVRVTTAKYYTPSGRLIQRDYKGRKLREYYTEAMELDSLWADEDSLENRPQYRTQAGRLVYGGGGIRPDIVVPYESYAKSPKLINKMFVNRLFFEFSNRYAKQHPKPNGNLSAFLQNFDIDEPILNEFKNFCKEQELELEEESFERDKRFISARLKAEIARYFWDKDGFYYVWLHNDNQFLEALKSFEEANRIALLNNSEKAKKSAEY